MSFLLHTFFSTVLFREDLFRSEENSQCIPKSIFSHQLFRCDQDPLCTERFFAHWKEAVFLHICACTCLDPPYGLMLMNKVTVSVCLCFHAVTIVYIHMCSLKNRSSCVFAIKYIYGPLWNTVQKGIMFSFDYYCSGDLINYILLWYHFSTKQCVYELYCE